MPVKQISIFVENKPGSLADVTKVLGEKNINIRALSMVGIGDFGIIRLIVDTPEKANDILQKEGFTVGSTDAIAIEMKDEPGSLAEIAEIFRKNGITLEYAYAFVAKTGEKAILIARVDDIEKSENALKKAEINLIRPEKLYSI
jgi:hypothetical protein